MENEDRRSPVTGDFYSLGREDWLMNKFEYEYLSPDFYETLKPEYMYEWLVKALSSTPQIHTEAHTKLTQMSSHPNFAIALVRVVAASLASFSNDFYPEAKVREAAAAKLKHHLLLRSSTLCCWERDRFKSIIFCLLLSLPDLAAEAEASEALSDAFDTLCGDESSWHRPMLELFHRLKQSSPHASSIAQMVDIASSFTSKLLTPPHAGLLVSQFKRCFKNFTEPLYDIFFRIDALIDDEKLKLKSSSSRDSAVLRFLVDSLLLCHKIFCSTMIFPLHGLSKMPRWHDHCRKHLSLEDNNDNGLGLSQVSIALCETLAVLLHRWPFRYAHERQFPLSEQVAIPLITLLEALSANASSSVGSHPLIIAAIRVLIRMWECLSFSPKSALPFVGRILHNIVIPNLRLMGEDVELFHANYLDFISFDLDMEGSDSRCLSLSLSRRTIASKLLIRLAADYIMDREGFYSIHPYYEDMVVPLVLAEVSGMLAENPAVNWKEKDCAIQLVLSLVPEEYVWPYPELLQKPRRKLNRRLDTALDFFAKVILPELQSQQVNEFPVLKAGALKFFAMFHTYVPRCLAVKLIPHVLRFLGSDSFVVRSYSAVCIEKLFMARDSSVRQTRATDITRFVPTVVTNLCDALKNPWFEANPYVMKCIKQVLGVPDVPSIIFEPCFASLASFLHQVCVDRKNPFFYGYLFEALAVLVPRACNEDSTMLPVFEAGLFPIFRLALDSDLVDLFPHALQLLACLVNLNMPPLSANYIQLFELVQSHHLWKRSSNVSHLVVLLHAFLDKASIQLIQQERLIQLLHIFEVLVSSSSTEESGFHMLNVILVNLDYDLFAPLAAHIWPIVYRLLHDYPTVKILKSLVICLSLFVVKYGAARLESSMNDFQPDLFLSVLELSWIPSLKFIKGAIEEKLSAIASIMVLFCGSATFQDDSGAQLWGKMLNSVITFLTQSKHNGIKGELGASETQETEGCFGTSLHAVVYKLEDLLKNVKDPKEFLVASLAQLSSFSSGRYSDTIHKSLDVVNQTALEHLCGIYSSVLV